jgi:hypothetical protein
MDIGKRTIASLLTVIALLLTAHLVVQVSRPAAAGGAAGVDPCPSDINDDATVDVVDFLQLLGDWGPCPNPPRLIDVSYLEGNSSVVRLWTDGSVEAAYVVGQGDCAPPVLCSPWHEVAGPSPHAEVSQATGVAHSASVLVRTWADGYVDAIRLSVNQCGTTGTCGDFAPLP